MARVTRHGSLRTEVYCKLRDEILQGRYSRGTTLTESQLSLDMGVSRTPVREAISQLEQDGLVHSTPNKSIIVQGFDEHDMLDLYDVRRQMETIAAARAAELMTAEQRQALKAAFEREVHDTLNNDNVEELQDLDNIFHELIFQGSGSKILRKILTSINTYTRYARTISLATQGRSRKVLDEHARILEAISRNDCQAASQAMRTHIDNATANFMNANGKGGTSNE